MYKKSHVLSFRITKTPQIVIISQSKISVQITSTIIWSMVLPQKRVLITDT